ncbi:MAG: energy-coupling factor transporter ATPase [Armatimonadota bacterium]|nr:energy-coupling factor transporter ATPase [Armatimonadota bacterium]MDR7427956.1 energy-coupling factor transporter ATPase [Armatimonadota bacterium]MDR7464139.1 energy-coupling factor transporter ATPase [Armatimonadota bacterium]MDR7470430.1 energy-coupling factor transporter ATPase [Armatimonadota bacterium]MDR7473512.1 energy-coupling factor transporter ATPase [Armatimonadota bacterium]
MQVENLSYVYNPGTPQAVVALDGVSLQLERGEYVALVGANGSGKSTLAKCLNALLVPTSGRVLVDGLDTRDPHVVWQVRQRVGMVFQNPDNQLVATVVEEDVAFGPENLGLPPAEIRRRVEEALRIVGMWEHRRHAPHLLSGGQKQRVAIAGMLAMRPSCLILDEATAMLDPQGRAEVLQTVARLTREEGITVVHITHAMEEAALARRMVVLAGGRVVLQGTPAEVFEKPEILRRLQLTLPPAAALGRQLRAAGLPLRGPLTTVDQLVDALTALAAARRS